MSVYLPRRAFFLALSALALCAGIRAVAAQDMPPADKPPMEGDAPVPPPPMPPDLPGDGDGGRPPMRGGDGKERRGGPSPERMKAFWESLTEQERKQFEENKERWSKMAPEEKRDMIQRHIRAASRLNREVDQIIEQSGVEFSPERRAKFTDEYFAKRRELEQEIAQQMDDLRGEKIPGLIDELRADFPELGDTKFTDIGKRRREKDGKDGPGPGNAPGEGPRDGGPRFGPRPGGPGGDPGAGLPPGPPPMFTPTGNDAPGRPAPGGGMMPPPLSQPPPPPEAK